MTEYFMDSACSVFSVIVLFTDWLCEADKNEFSSQNNLLSVPCLIYFTTNCRQYQAKEQTGAILVHLCTLRPVTSRRNGLTSTLGLFVTVRTETLYSCFKTLVPLNSL